LKSVVAMDIPPDVALLPFKEKIKYIIMLRKQGKTYREIQKILKVSPRDISKALELENHKDDIEELKNKIGEFEERLLKIEKAIKELHNFQTRILWKFS